MKTYLYCIILLACFNNLPSTGLQESIEIRGVTFVPGPDKPSEMDFSNLKALGCNWVALTPLAKCSKSGLLDKDHFNYWYGFSDEGLISCIRMAHKHGLKVMIKPQLIVDDGWAGDILPSGSIEMENWKKSYRSFILHHLDIAEKENADIFCMGTELKNAVQLNHSFFRQLILDCRQRFSGDISYSANWDNYKDVPFWQLCDYIGISAYFPLSEQKVPRIQELNNSWKKHIRKLRIYAIKKGKPVLFTEWGYLSTEYASRGHWIIEENLDAYPANEQAQYNAYESMLTQISSNSFLSGGFVWKWYAHDFPPEDKVHKDYTPQDKKAVESLKKWYNAY